MPRFKTPELTVERLSMYLRAIKKFHEDEILSSQRLAELVGTSDGQVRKDLAYFGELGVPGHVKLRNVDLAIQLEGLSYFLTQVGPELRALLPQPVLW